MKVFCIKIVFIYFQLCGFCHFAHNLEPMSKRNHQIYIIVAGIHLIILSSIVSATIYYADDIFMMGDMVSATTDILHFLLPVLSQYSGIIESIRTRSFRRRFWIHVNLIDSNILATSSQHVHHSVRRYLFKAIFIQISMTMVEVFVFIRVRADEIWQNHILITFYTYFMCRSQILFCVFFIEMLKCRMDMLTIRLKSMRSGQHCLNALSMMRCKKSFGIMWQCLEDINRSFGWSMLWTVISHFVCIIVGFYWGIMSAYFRSSPYLFEVFLTPIPHVVSVFILFYSVESLRHSVCIRTINGK